MMRRILLPLLTLFIAISLCAHAGGFSDRGVGAAAFVPQPRLISPTEDTVVFTGKATLEFKWSPFEGNRTERLYYDFRLYKGYNMLESTLILKKRLEPNIYEISLKSDIFDDGEVYTWSLRQVYSGTQKSEKNTASFKVIKK